MVEKLKTLVPVLGEILVSDDKAIRFIAFLSWLGLAALVYVLLGNQTKLPRIEDLEHRIRTIERRQVEQYFEARGAYPRGYYVDDDRPKGSMSYEQKTQEEIEAMQERNLRSTQD